jgi:hypothetical protein
VYCIIGRIEDQPGSNQIEVSDPYSSPAIAFELNSGETADCTWFNVMQPPATPTAPNTGNGGGNRGNTPTPVAAGPASLTLALYDCPATYDPLSTDANPNADCRQSNESIAGFTLAGETGAPQSQSPDGSNRVEFGTLDAGRYLLSAHFSADAATAFIGSCSSNAWNTGDYNFTPFAGIAADGRAGIQLKPGEHLDCAWYTIPGASASTAAITLTVLTCPGQSVAASECEPGEAGTTFHLTPVGDQGSGLSLTTNGNGTARGNIEPGMYELEQLGANWCAADSAAFDQNGTLTVTGDDIDVTIYNCAG